MATRSSLMRPIENIQNSIDNETVGVFIIACPHFLTYANHTDQDER